MHMIFVLLLFEFSKISLLRRTQAELQVKDFIFSVQSFQYYFVILLV